MHRVRLYLPERAHSAGLIYAGTLGYRVSTCFVPNCFLSKVIVCSLLGVVLDTDGVLFWCLHLPQLLPKT